MNKDITKLLKCYATYCDTNIDCLLTERQMVLSKEYTIKIDELFDRYLSSMAEFKNCIELILKHKD